MLIIYNIDIYSYVEIERKILIYFKYTKPRVWALLVYVGTVGSIMAAGAEVAQKLNLIFLAIFTLIAGTAGAEAITNYIDRDIDSRMQRTAGRPLPAGQITDAGAQIFGYVLISTAIIPLVLFGRYYAAIFMFTGIFDNVFIYSFLLKRKTPWSVIFGGFSGGFPVIIGWYTVTDNFSITPFLLFLLVIIWIPIHIWSIAYLYREDYSSAGVPMLPVVCSERTTSWAITISSLLLSVFSLLLYFVGENSIIYMNLAIILSIPLIYYSIRFMKKPTRKTSLALFKYSSMYLAIIFSAFMILGLASGI